MNHTNSIRILIADDHEVVRRGLSLFLRPFDEFELVGEATNGLEAVESCDRLSPDVVLMDIVMPDMNGLEATRIIRQKHPNIHVLALTTFKDEDVVREMLKAGAVGYLLKNTSVDELASAIHTAMTGKLTLAPEAAQALLQPQPQTATTNYNLTDREHEVLELMVEGLNNIEIAERLFVARSTVKFHVSSILAKTSATSRVEAVSIALKAGLIKR